MKIKMFHILILVEEQARPVLCMGNKIALRKLQTTVGKAEWRRGYGKKQCD
ncbi:MAG: hypothetical protein ACI4D2_00905 [Lachnospiraceae bacterium]